MLFVIQMVIFDIDSWGEEIWILISSLATPKNPFEPLLIVIKEKFFFHILWLQAYCCVLELGEAKF